MRRGRRSTRRRSRRTDRSSCAAAASRRQSPSATSRTSKPRASAMSAADVQTLRSIYAAWAEGKFWTFELFHHDVETRWSTEVPDIEGARGVEGLGELFREWTSAWESCRIEAEEFHDMGEQVVVFVKVCARGSGSSIDVEMKNAHTWTMRDGRAAAIRAHTDRDRALREAS